MLPLVGYTVGILALVVLVGCIACACKFFWKAIKTDWSQL